MKNDRDQYRLADIMIATILGGSIALTLSLCSDLLLHPLLFPGDLCVAGLITGACFGIIAGRSGSNFLHDTLEELKAALQDWYNFRH